MSQELQEHAKEIRRNVVTMICTTGASHIGCSMGIVDILTTLYFRIMNIDPTNPQWEDRDRFIISKGHASAAFYSTLAERGFFPKEELKDFLQDGSPIAAHVTLGSLPGIEATAGSLGHGLSMGIGMAWSALQKEKKFNTYVLLGDGECQEGSVWEAIIYAGANKIDNLTIIIDNNDFQSEDRVSVIMDSFPFDEKLKPFGWKTVNVDGHNYDALEKALKTPHPNQPLAVIAKTIKGKGVSFLENKYEWHGKCPSEEQFKIAMEELK